MPRCRAVPSSGSSSRAAITARTLVQGSRPGRVSGSARSCPMLSCRWLGNVARSRCRGAVSMRSSASPQRQPIAYSDRVADAQFDRDLVAQPHQERVAAQLGRLQHGRGELAVDGFLESGVQHVQPPSSRMTACILSAHGVPSRLENARPEVIVVGRMFRNGAFANRRSRASRGLGPMPSQHLRAVLAQFERQAAQLLELLRALQCGRLSKKLLTSLTCGP